MDRGVTLVLRHESRISVRHRRIQSQLVAALKPLSPVEARDQHSAPQGRQGRLGLEGYHLPREWHPVLCVVPCEFGSNCMKGVSTPLVRCESPTSRLPLRRVRGDENLNGHLDGLMAQWFGRAVHVHRRLVVGAVLPAFLPLPAKTHGPSCSPMHHLSCTSRSSSQIDASWSLQGVTCHRGRRQLRASSRGRPVGSHHRDAGERPAVFLSCLWSLTSQVFLTFGVDRRYARCSAPDPRRGPHCALKNVLEHMEELTKKHEQLEMARQLNEAWLRQHLAADHPVLPYHLACGQLGYVPSLSSRSSLFYAVYSSGL
ncbi:hypothetical protein LXA43DRAFT_508763 [Ganoderma leucocontextum]|nr:hypothetical protein LXA43DRAFT_508763 [Ganoderma leucocontextum]